MIADSRNSKPSAVDSLFPSRAPVGLGRAFFRNLVRAATDYRTKKRLVRLLIEEIMASVVADQSIELVIHWKGDKHSTLYVRRNRTGEHRYTTDREVVEVW